MLDDLIVYAHDKAIEYPEHRNAIMELVEVACDEVENGESEDHETEMAYSEIAELIGE